MLRRNTSNCRGYSILCSAAVNGPSYTLSTSGRRISAPLTVPFSTKRPRHRLPGEPGEIRLITRGVSVFSPTLGVSGQCDVLEYHRGSTGIPLTGRQGLWQPYPVEYKRGQPREDTGDALQLCGQAMCLESMLCCDIPEGALYYGEIRRRQRVRFTPELRQQVEAMLDEMNQLYRRATPPR